MQTFFDNIKNRFLEQPPTIAIIICALDVLFFATLLYVAFSFLKKNNAERLVFFIVPFILLGAVLSALKMPDGSVGFPLTGSVISFAVLFAALTIVILFPAETRRSLWKLSSPRESWETFNTKYEVSDEELTAAIEHIVRATQNMAKKNTGALIVIAPEDLPAHILDSGTAVDGKVSNSLIETFFHNKSPLHDGAVVISGNRVIAAGCFLPLSQDRTIDKELGTRHRAAIGITEEYRVFAIIVSEETGVISTASGGKLTRYYDSVMLTDALMQVYGLKAVSSVKRRKK
ncbi:MAG: diadenylate cyclase [Firmicutes bacterium]|nr:diadenylate cyclase [Bacillota bacterium]